MGSQGESEIFSITYATLLEKPFADIISAPLRDLRKVLQDGPEPFAQRADSGNRNDVLAAVLELRHSMATSNNQTNEDEANSKKLFEMPTEELLRLANVARPNVVRLMQSALRFDETLRPRDFDPGNASSVVTVALTWKLDSTNRALQDSLSQNQINISADPTQSRRNGSQAPNLTPQNSAFPIPPNRNQAPNPVPQNNSSTVTPTALPSSNPFAAPTTDANILNPLEISNALNASAGQKRTNELTLQPQSDPKRVRFCNLGDINSAQRAMNNHIPGQDFRNGGSPTEQLPPHLMGEYIGRSNSKLVLRVTEFKGAEILAGLLQEGVNVEIAVRNRLWKRPVSGEPYQCEQEAINLARTIHLTLMVFPTVADALNSAPWLETCLRRLYAILYVESHTNVAPRNTLWKIAQSVLETNAESSLQVPSMEKSMAQHAALVSKEHNALSSLSKRNARSQKGDYNNRRKGTTNEKTKSE